MNLQKIKTILRQNIIFYFTGLLILFGLKLFYSRAGSDELTWILTPTTRWVSILSGISFTYISGMGYVNQSLKYVIAPSCSGVRFMIITIAMLIFSFVHRMEIPDRELRCKFHFPMKKGFFWILGSVVFSYLITIFVNGLRIILAVYIPLCLDELHIYSRILTPDRVHTLIGTTVYFISLISIFHLADSFSFKMMPLPAEPGLHSKTNSGKAANRSSCCLKQFIRKCLPPVFWYFFIVLGIPFLNKAYKNESRSFMEFAGLITGACLVILLFFCLIFILQKRLYSRR